MTTASGLVIQRTYEQERSSATGFAIAGAIGGLVAIGAGIRIRQWNRALRRAWAARQAQQPMPDAS